MRCKTCHYSLTGLTDREGGAGGHRCPECGRDFDPSDPSTFDFDSDSARSIEARTRRIALRVTLVVIGSVLLGLGILIAIIYWMMGQVLRSEHF